MSKYCPFCESECKCDKWCALYDENSGQCAILLIARKMSELEKDVREK